MKPVLFAYLAILLISAPGAFAIGDLDSDGVADASDNCPLIANPSQQDSGNASTGDACEFTRGAFRFTALGPAPNIGSLTSGVLNDDGDAVIRVPSASNGALVRFDENGFAYVVNISQYSVQDFDYNTADELVFSTGASYYLVENGAFTLLHTGSDTGTLFDLNNLGELVTLGTGISQPIYYDTTDPSFNRIVITTNPSGFNFLSGLSDTGKTLYRSSDASTVNVVSLSGQIVSLANASTPVRGFGLGTAALSTNGRMLFTGTVPPSSSIGLYEPLVNGSLVRRETVQPAPSDIHVADDGDYLVAINGNIVQVRYKVENPLNNFVYLYPATGGLSGASYYGLDFFGSIPTQIRALDLSEDDSILLRVSLVDGRNLFVLLERLPDEDNDGVPDSSDVCLNDPLNDNDGDGICFASDACPADPDNDADNDGLCYPLDQCPLDPQNDVDGDFVCGEIDNCAVDYNPGQEDDDGDGVGEYCDYCPFDTDEDADFVCTAFDNCPLVDNGDQSNTDGDSLGDVCDACPLDGDNDADGDGYCSDFDNCPLYSNSGQEDIDVDFIGDSCDVCPLVSDPGQEDSDFDGIGDACEVVLDTDGDGIPDATDSCPLDVSNDVDSDGVCGAVDNCPVTANANQVDTDADSLGDVCDVCSLDPDNDLDGDLLCGNVDACPLDSDNDVDNDMVCGNVDNCPFKANTDQADTNADGYGDVCVPPNVAVGPGTTIGDSTTFGQGATVGANSSIGNNVSVAKGSDIGSNVVVGSLSTIEKDSEIGAGSKIGTNTTIAKEADIGMNVIVGSNVIIAKGVVIGDNSHIGDFVVLQKDSVLGSNVIVGNGATVSMNAVVPSGTVIAAGSTWS